MTGTIPGRAARLDVEACVDLLGVAMGFEGVGTEAREELAQRSFGRRFEKGEFIFHEEDSPDYFHVVAEGRVRVSSMTPSGKRFTAVVADRGATLNAVVLFDAVPRFLSAQTLEEALVLFTPRQDFLDFVMKYPKVAVNIITVLGRLLQSGYKRTMDLMEERAEQRIINVLYVLFKRFGDTLKFTNKEIAELAETTTETTIRTMRHFRESGLIQSKWGVIRIVDPARLEKQSAGFLWM